VKILNLAIQNFMAIGEAEISLADRGLVLVEGENRDDTSANSNGAGKSSIADALCWALFGTTARGESGDTIVNQKAGKECMVSVILEDDGDKYMINRFRKHSKGKNAVQLWRSNTAPGVDLSKGTDKLTQVEIEKILGCSYEVFRASIYAGQDTMPDLPGMTDRNLKALVEEAAGVTILEAAYAEARARLGAAKNLADESVRRKQSLNEQIGQSEGLLADLVADRDTWTLNQANKLVAARALVATKEEEAERLRKAINSADLPTIESKIKGLEVALAAVGGEQAEERKLESSLGRLTSSLDVKNAKLKALKEQHDRAKTAIAGVDHKIGCPCDECGRPLTALELVPLKSTYESKLRVIATEFSSIRDEAVTALAARKTLTESLEAFRASMTDTTSSIALSKLLNDERNAILAQTEVLARILREIRLADKAVKDLGAEVNPHVGRIDKLSKEIEDKLKSLDLVNETIAAHTTHLTIAENAAKVFSPAGVRGQILDEVTPYLNDQTAKYLGTLSDGNIRGTWTTLVRNSKGELREKFAIEVDNSKGGSSFGLLSGGEKRKVMIAAALALQDLVSSRATKQINLFIGDEIDNALDSAGIERLMAILEEKAKERGTVFVISHTPLRDWISNVITVIKEGEVSRIEASVA